MIVCIKVINHSSAQLMETWSLVLLCLGVAFLFNHLLKDMQTASHSASTKANMRNKAKLLEDNKNKLILTNLLVSCGETFFTTKKLESLKEAGKVEFCQDHSFILFLSRSIK